MFDQNYFLEDLRKQVEEVGGNPVVRLILHNGQEYLIRDVVESRAGYALLNVHPLRATAGIVAPSSSAYSRVPDSGYYPLAIAYESISQVQLSSTTADQRPQIGFYE